MPVSATIVTVVQHRGELLATTSIEDYREIVGWHSSSCLPAIVLVFMRYAGLPTIGVTRLTAVRATTYILATIEVLATFSRTHMVCLAAGLVCTVNPGLLQKSQELHGGSAGRRNLISTRIQLFP